MAVGMDIRIRRLAVKDAEAASAVTCVMAQTFGQGQGSPPARMARLLADDRFWLYGAFAGEVPVAGLSAHVFPVTAHDGFELFIYDIAVPAARQR